MACRLSAIRIGRLRVADVASVFEAIGEQNRSAGAENSVTAVDLVPSPGSGKGSFQHLAAQGLHLEALSIRHRGIGRA